MRRKPGTLIEIERAALAAGLELRREGVDEFHGYLLAKRMQAMREARLLVGHGTLYKALERLEETGLLASRWEDPQAAAAEGRPRRRLYHVTAQGGAALAQQPAALKVPVRLRQRVVEA